MRDVFLKRLANKDDSASMIVNVGEASAKPRIKPLKIEETSMESSE
jgi:hypothetical protein